MSDEGVNRGAILIMSLGEDAAVEVFKHLGPKEVQKLTTAMSKMAPVSREEVGAVLQDFRAQADQQTGLQHEGDEYIRNLLIKSLGPEKASAIIDRILQGGDSEGIESLKWMEANAVAELIKNEHPQVIATILVHLDADQAAEILGFLVERLRNDVVLRIATMEGIQPSAMRDLNDALTQLLEGTDRVKTSARGGVGAAAEILNFLGATVEASVSTHIRDADPDLAQKIQDKMFVFENLLDLDDRSIQLLLREIQSETLIVALKGTSEPMKEKILKNMSQRAAEMLRDDLESRGPVRLSEVENEQREILRTVRRLADDGQIVLGGKGDEGLVQ